VTPRSSGHRARLVIAALSTGYRRLTLRPISGGVPRERVRSVTRCGHAASGSMLDCSRSEKGSKRPMRGHSLILVRYADHVAMQQACTMRVRHGDIPIKRFQRMLVSQFLGLWLTFVITGAISLALLPARTAIAAALLITFAVFTAVFIRNWLHPASCPYCQSEARYSDDAHTRWRHKFPYGFSPGCHGCGADLTKPFDLEVITTTSVGQR
jgi:hypothetical protein